MSKACLLLVAILPLNNICSNINISEGILPYLENIVYSLNKLQESMAGKNKGNSDIIDKLF